MWGCPWRELVCVNLAKRLASGLCSIGGWGVRHSLKPYSEKTNSKYICKLTLTALLCLFQSYFRGSLPTVVWCFLALITSVARFQSCPFLSFHWGFPYLIKGCVSVMDFTHFPEDGWRWEAGIGLAWLPGALLCWVPTLPACKGGWPPGRVTLPDLA